MKWLVLMRNGGINMKKEEALQAVEKGCNHIMQTAKSVENALLLFDDFANAIIIWKVCGIIDESTQQECTDFVINSKKIYRSSLSKSRKG